MLLLEGGVRVNTLRMMNLHKHWLLVSTMLVLSYIGHIFPKKGISNRKRKVMIKTRMDK